MKRRANSMHWAAVSPSWPVLIRKQTRPSRGWTSAVVKSAKLALLTHRDVEEFDLGGRAGRR